MRMVTSGIDGSKAIDYGKKFRLVFPHRDKVNFSLWEWAESPLCVVAQLLKVMAEQAQSLKSSDLKKKNLGSICNTWNILKVQQLATHMEFHTNTVHSGVFYRGEYMLPARTITSDET